MIYDVAVIGLGPAGATLCRTLDKNLKVIAFDKKSDNCREEGFKKPCGGLLAPDAQKSLSRFNLTLPLDVLVGPQIFSVRTIDLGANISKHYQRHYINLDRHKFDLWLTSLIPPHVKIHNNTRCTDIKLSAEGHYIVTFKENNAEYSIKAKQLVGADGANSIVRKAIYPNKNLRTYLSVQQWYKDSHATPFYSCVFDSAITDCYAWGMTKDGYFIFGGAFHPKNARQSFERLKLKLKNHGFKLGQPLKTEACLVLRPTGAASFCCGKDNAFLIGEAAGFISPSSLEGISYAINSGYLLSRCLSGKYKNPNRAYKKATFKLRVSLIIKVIKSFFIYNPLLRRLIMKSGIKTITVLNDNDD